VTLDFAGTIFGLSGRCPDVAFTIGLARITADNSTDFNKSKCGDLRDGRSASGHGVLQLTGTIKATQIEVRKDDHD
jgi:hypothetical protein